MTAMAALAAASVSNTAAHVEELGRLTPIAEFRGLQMYHFSGNDCPAALAEIGRLREKGFKAIGAGTGRECDLDEYDTGENAYYQLVAWDPDEKEMVAIYRCQPGSRCSVKGGPARKLRTAFLFDFSDTFHHNLLPHAIELGRTVVNPNAKRHCFGFFAIWKGLGALLRMHPAVRYFFGTVSLHTHMNPDAVRCLIGYLQRHYTPPEPLLTAKSEIAYDPEVHATGPMDRGEPADPNASERRPPGAATRDIPDAVAPGDPDTPEKRIKHLAALMARHGEAIPMILKSYMSLTNGIWFDGAVIDHVFLDAYIIGLVVPLENIDPAVRSKFMQDQ